MSPTIITLLVVGFLVMDAAILGAVTTSIIGGMWNTLAARFPSREPAPDAVLREFQSVALGIAKFGGCVHIAVDDHALHLRPARILRFFGARGISVPWDQITVRRHLRFFRQECVEVAIGTTTLVGPKWCLALAPEPAAATE